MLTDVIMLKMMLHKKIMLDNRVVLDKRMMLVEGYKIAYLMMVTFITVTITIMLFQMVVLCGVFFP